MGTPCAAAGLRGANCTRHWARLNVQHKGPEQRRREIPFMRWLGASVCFDIGFDGLYNSSCLKHNSEVNHLLLFSHGTSLGWHRYGDYLVQMSTKEDGCDYAHEQCARTDR